ncbi:MAG: DUF3108 domain-containing protein [Bdellovibrionota bacterium]
MTSKLNKLKLILVLIAVLVTSCSSFLKYDKRKAEFKTEEFDKKVKIIEVAEPAEAAEAVTEPDESSKTNAVEPASEIKPLVIKKIKKNKLPQKNKLEILKRQPEVEDSEGFSHERRPLIDPFTVGEKLIHEISYLGTSAAKLILATKPFALVNGKKNYNFFIDVKTYSFFSRIYAVDDQFQTYLDYETLSPGAYKIDIKDSKQIKEVRAFFDFESLKADYWEHKYTEEDGHEEKKLSWTILPYSQNLVSAIFYMRVFKWNIGKEYVFRVSDNEKNVIFKAKALEKKVLSTEAGEFNAIKLKAEVVTRGNLAKARDFYIWVSDDDKKYVLRIEVALPVGSLISEVVEIRKR